MVEGVRRQRLDAMLDRGLDHTLTLVSAGPGFGKTLTVASWVRRRQSDHAIGWLALDQTDDSPHSFWSGLLAAIRASGALPDGSALNDVIPASVFGAREVDIVLAGLADLRRRLVLVLDDFHLIKNPEVLASVGLLLERPPARLTLVLITRSDPVLPLHRVRVAGQLVEIRSRDLAFSRPEAAELFAIEGFRLRDDQLDTLYARTEGWAAGLRLAAMSLDPDDVDASVERVTGSDRAIAEYLIGEVLQRVAPDEREFLLHTSVVDRVCGDLADAITGGTHGQQLLEHLQATNTFVTALDTENRWFRFHPLLRDLLRHRLMLEQRDGVPELHRRVAAWQAAHGDPIESVRSSIKAGDWDRAGRTMLACIPLILSVQAPALAKAIEPMVRRANENPALFELLAASAFHMQRRDYGSMSRDTAEARQYLDAAPADLRGTATVVLDLFDQAACRMSGNSARQIELCRGVLHMLDQTPRREIPLGRHFRAVATGNLGVGQLWTDDIDAADRSLADADQQLGDLGMELAVLNTLSYHALLDAMVGRCRRAERRARVALENVDRRGWGSEIQGMSLHLALSLVLAARGHTDQAAKAVARGLAGTAGTHTDRAVRLGLAIAAVEVAVLRGDGAAALEADSRVRAGIARTPGTPIRMRRWADAAGASAMILDGRPAEAIDRLGELAPDRGFSAAWQRVWLARALLDTGALHRMDGVLRPLTEPGWQYREPVVFARLLLAVLAERQHRDGVALTELTAAVELAQAEGIRRPFLMLGDRLTGMLRRYLVLDGAHPAFVTGLVGEAHEPPRENGGLEHLTERELIVLKYLPTMLKAGEIADDLFVSVNTVKAHLRSMYRKLGVSNRREAVERARALGLL
ncbi:LuxR C-terminal-related transcriptional regulator [Nakamurella sp.]|uniref:LuxR C-terminal-related transcriptional regulator n=1 Tax=Nakamurella sp. TaxID=1869182 RepID=UPI0037840538